MSPCCEFCPAHTTHIRIKKQEQLPEERAALHPLLRETPALPQELSRLWWVLHSLIHSFIDSFLLLQPLPALSELCTQWFPIKLL